MLFAAILGAAMLQGAPPAQAGSFNVVACGTAPGLANHSWAPFDNDASHLATANACGEPDVTGESAATSGLVTTDILSLATMLPTGDAAGWTFAASSGDQIAAITMDRDLYFGLGSGWFPEVVDASDSPLPGEVCLFVMGETSCELQGTTTHAGLSTATITIQLLCNAAPFGQSSCLTGSSLHHARAELNSATVTVTDNQPPTLTGTAGPLLTSSTYQHGTLAGTISGADNSGVSSVRVYVDGNPVVQSAFNCDYTYAQPCPATATSPTLSLDTTRLADGPHQVQAAVIDAAGNETRGPVGQLLVANHPPGAPVGAAVTNAATGWINHAATISWKNPAQGSGLPIAGVDWVACRGVDSTLPASGCGAIHTQATLLTSLNEDPRTEAAFAGHAPASYTVFLWLVDSAGDLNPASPGRASFGFDDTAPGPPTSLAATPSSTGKSFVIRATPPAHVAPIASTSWVACKTGGRCTTAKTVSGQTFGFDPATNPTFRSASRGTYVVRAWLHDAAGNGSSTAAASISLAYPPAGHAKALSRAPSPRIHISTVTLRGRDLRVAGTANRSLDGHVHVVDRYRTAAAEHLLRDTGVVAAGHFSVRFVQPRGAHVERVTVSFSGDKHLRAETVTRKLGS
jgi:hypothetical protein